MRVVTFTSLFPNAQEPSRCIFVYQRVAALARRPGHQIDVIAPHPYAPGWLRGTRYGRLAGLPRQGPVGELTVHHPRYLLAPKLSMPLQGVSMALAAYRCLRRLHAQSPIDCIDAHYVYPDGLAAVLLGRMLRVPVVVSARGTDIDLFPSFRLIRPQIVWTLSHAAGIVAVSRSLKRGILALGVAPDRVRVIPNGIDVQRFDAVDRPRARRQLGLPEADKIVLSVGSLTASKRHELLIDSVAGLVSRVPSLRVYILGEGPLRPALQAAVARRQLQDHVQLVGARPNEELRLWFSAADVSCLASAREGWPNVVSESLACGTPVVATRVGGIPEIVTSSDEGLLVAADGQDLGEALEAALARSWDRAAVARLTRDRTWDVVAAEVEACLLETLGAPGRQPALRS